MKNLKIALACILFVALAAIGSAFSGKKTFDGSLSERYKGPLFANGLTLNSDVQNASNWDEEEVSDEVCPDSDFFCGFVATWVGTPTSPITESDILAAIFTEYNRLSSSFPTDPYQFQTTIKGVTVTITIYLFTPEA